MEGVRDRVAYTTARGAQGGFIALERPQNQKLAGAAAQAIQGAPVQSRRPLPQPRCSATHLFACAAQVAHQLWVALAEVCIQSSACVSCNGCKLCGRELRKGQVQLRRRAGMGSTGGGVGGASAQLGNRCSWLACTRQQSRAQQARVRSSSAQPPLRTLMTAAMTAVLPQVQFLVSC